MSEWVHFFEDPEPRLEQVGGKGLNLCRLVEANIPVPPGFVLMGAAYRAFVESNELDPVLRELGSVGSGDDTVLETNASAIVEAFTRASMPAGIADAVLAAYVELCRVCADDTAVAVRSSGIDEDSSEHSYAGQYDTFLNVPADDLLGKVKCCWASLWSARSIAYRARLGIPHPLALAVVVQQIARADASGVAFTVNPVSGSRKEVVVNATWGLGEALVSGRVTPDNYVVDKASGTVKIAHAGDKCIAIMPAESGGTIEETVPETRAGQRVLSDPELARLVKLFCRIEVLMGSPQDIEWCIERGRLYVIQSRPISTLREESESWPAPAEGMWVHGGGAIELLTEPVSPLFETFFIPVYDRALLQWMSRIGLADALHWPIIRGVNGFIFGCLDVRLRPRHLRAVLRDFREHMHSMREWPVEVRRYREEVERLNSPALRITGSVSIYNRIEALLHAALRYWIHVSMIAQPIYRAERRLMKFCTSLRGADHLDPHELLRGLEMRPVEAEFSVYELAKLAAASSDANLLLTSLASGSERVDRDLESFREHLNDHLQRFGHQIYSFDPLIPTLAEDSRPVIAAMHAYLMGKEPPATRFSRLAAQRDAMATRIVATLSRRRQHKFRAVLAAAQQAVCLRENALFELGYAWRPLRQALLELGQRLTKQGVIATPQDIFWLTGEELRAAVAKADVGTSNVPHATRDRVPERQAAWRRRQGLRPPYILPVGSKPKFWWKYVFPMPELCTQPTNDVIRGTGVSPGRVASIARVIRTHDEIVRLRDGEILVARTTPPAWTPLLTRAGGLVTDLGGPLTHSSIIAREYGIPAVMGTGSATHQIRDGQSIVVDGTSGCVFLTSTSALTPN